MAVASVALRSGSRAPRRSPNHSQEIGTIVYLTYTPATSYSTGGDAIDIAAALPFWVRGAPFLVQAVQNATTLGYQAAWDGTNKKILLWNGTTQATSTTDLSAAKFDLIVYVK